MTSKIDDEVGKEILLETLVEKSSGRTIAYGRAGDLHSTTTPLVFFPALGGTSRVLLALHDEAAMRSLHVICIDRPGTGISSAPSTSNSPRDHVDTYCSDVLAVLDFLQLERVGILAVCAGTASALAFCSQHPTRTSGKVVLVAPWVLPADCPSTKWLDRFAAQWLPRRPVSAIVAFTEVALLSFFSSASIAQAVREKASDEERKCLDAKYDGSCPRRDFAKCMEYMLPSGQLGDVTNDVAVCLSTSNTLGIDYEKLGTNDIKVLIWHGEQDGMVPLPAAQWLAQQIPQSELRIVLQGTHGGALFVCVTECLDCLK